jgi:hypothetical protein
MMSVHNYSKTFGPKTAPKAHHSSSHFIIVAGVKLQLGPIKHCSLSTIIALLP